MTSPESLVLCPGCACRMTLCTDDVSVFYYCKVCKRTQPVSHGIVLEQEA